MALTCTRCEGTGFLNTHLLQDADAILLSELDHFEFLEFLSLSEDYEDVTVCDCCGNGEDEWYGIPGEHYNDDPQGDNGPYAYNGGLCECH